MILASLNRGERRTWERPVTEIYVSSGKLEVTSRGEVAVLTEGKGTDLKGAAGVAAFAPEESTSFHIVFEGESLERPVETWSGSEWGKGRWVPEGKGTQ